MTSTTLGQLLRSHRLRAVLTQGELADCTGVSLRTIRDMERGRVQRPRRFTVRLLAAGLGLTDQNTRELMRSVEAAGDATTPLPGPPPGVMCLLPPALDDLTGRDRELAWIERQVDKAAAAASLGVVVVHGPPGTGKTSLAVRAGHDLADRFPDGTMFVDMHGMDPEPPNPLQVVRRLLRALDVAGDIPEDEDRCISVYRSIMRHRRVLIIADNPTDEAQIRPLLAASPGSVVLVSSRNAMVSLEVTARLSLKLLSTGAACDLLDGVIGSKRAKDEAEDVARVARLCSGVPLALRIAGNRLATRPAWPVSQLADRLADERVRLGVLRAGDIHVQTAFEASYRRLDPKAAVLFRRLSLLPGSDTSVELAAVLTELPEPLTESLLEHLVDISLLAASETAGQYSLHDLLKVFAATQLKQHEAEAAAARARQRAYHWLLATTAAAARQFARENPPSQADLAVFPNRESAGVWLSSNKVNWLAAFRAAVADSRHAQVLEIATAMRWYPPCRSAPGLWQEMRTAGFRAAEALGRVRDPAIQLSFTAADTQR
ncbi:NB-ARC domain-containing protein [Streptomyces sp. NPDC094038]|uniref:NB-ARC domain-containing protein n=1 Tax=Streptomyces sp. NPDC094038 TaxID=3366055 RepID=UPI00381A1D25